ncbi:hypothetical protein HMSSN036_52670 [Paenibacillus macerans]|nr:hypothetical protein HMSSN036_52670 [Paenibacillus macerans]
MARTVHPDAREVLATYARGLNLEIAEVGWEAGVTDRKALETAITEDTAAVLVQNPNFFGSLEDIRAIGKLIHARGGLLIVSCNPLSLGLLEAPGKLGADIVVGDAQPLGIAPSFGGPTCGFSPWRTATCGGCPGGSSGRRPTVTASAGSC